MNKKYYRDASSFKKLVTGFGSCIASDRITIDGQLVGLMYRQEPTNDLDSGWRFLSGDESEEYANNPDNAGLFDVNTIANYDPAICRYIEAPIGTAVVRRGGELVVEANFKLPE
jgi:hypothetical protein